MFPAMKTAFTCLLAACLLFPWCNLLSAQQTPVVSEKKITITKRTTEANGTEVTETIVKKGAAAANFDVDAYVRENRSDKVQVEVRVEDPNQAPYSHRAIKKEIKKDGQKISSWSSNTSSASSQDNGAFLGVDADSDEDESQPGIVIEVVRRSAAAQAGLKTNDVLLRLNDQAINRWSDLTAFMNKAKPGDKIRILYQRKGQEATTEATLTRHSEVQWEEGEQHGFLGISNTTEEDGEAGVAVDITKNSAAAKAGLRDGDVVLQLNDTPITDFEDVTDFMADTKSGDQVRITYQRDGQRSITEATLGEPQDRNSDSNEEEGNDDSWNWVNEEVDVDVRQKEACLGVYTEENDQDEEKGTGARILSFTAESAAKEVQLQENDVITAVNGQPVQDHSELWAAIAKYKAGDRVQVDYLRNGEKRSVDAVLKPCQDNTSCVTVAEGDDQGRQKKRQFTTWNWDRDDQTQLRQTRMITIHKGGEGDAAKVNMPLSGTQPADRQLQLASFRAFLNPAQGQITVEFRGAPIATIVSLLDQSGRQMFREELNMFGGEYKQQFDLSEYAKGTIIILVQQGDKSFTEQVVLK